MISRKAAVVVLLTCGSVIGWLVYSLGEREPAYQGKNLKQWLKIYNGPRGNTPVERQQQQSVAAEAVRQMGTNALPTLMAWEDQDRQVGWKYRLHARLPAVLQKRRLVNDWLIWADNDRVSRAIVGFRLLGPQAASAVPELTRRMMTRKSLSGRDAVTALGNMGSTGLPALLAAVTNAQTPHRVWAVQILDTSRMALTNDLEIVQVLSRCVRDQDANVGAASAETLGWGSGHAELAVPALVDGLGDPRAPIRARSAEALGHQGSPARSAVPALLRCLNDSDPWVRQSVTNALQAIAPEVL